MSQKCSSRQTTPDHYCGWKIALKWSTAKVLCLVQIDGWSQPAPILSLVSCSSHGIFYFILQLLRGSATTYFDDYQESILFSIGWLVQSARIFSACIYVLLFSASQYYKTICFVTRENIHSNHITSLIKHTSWSKLQNGLYKNKSTTTNSVLVESASFIWGCILKRELKSQKLQQKLW